MKKLLLFAALAWPALSMLASVEAADRKAGVKPLTRKIPTSRPTRSPQKHTVAEDKDEMQLLVPAYFSPVVSGATVEGDWGRILKAAKAFPTVEIYAIVNPDSGPPSGAAPDYKALFDAAEPLKNLHLLGYVATNRGQPFTVPPTNTVSKLKERIRKHIIRWKTFSGSRVAGIFFDEQSNDLSDVGFYLDIFDLARTELPDKKVFSNPGTNCPPEYLNGTGGRKGADVICAYEADQECIKEVKTRCPECYAAGKILHEFELHEFEGHFANHRQLAALPYGTADDEPQKPNSHYFKLLTKARDQMLGYIFLTDDGSVNPWDVLPVYWEEQVLKIDSMNRKKR